MQPLVAAGLIAAAGVAIMPRFRSSPIPGPLHVVSPFGPRKSPFTGETTTHAGVDLRAAVGTPLLAVDDGVVESVEVGTSAGTIIRYRTNGAAGPGRVSCMHLERADVRAGDVVAAGQVIGATGATGKVTGPHLHFEWRPDSAGHAVNPCPFLPLAARLGLV